MRRFAEVKKARVVVAEDDGVLAGFYILHLESYEWGNAAYIVTLDVAKDYRRKGLGKRLIREIETQSVVASCDVIALHVFTENTAAIRFYEGEGFVFSQRIEGFYGEGIDAFLYQKAL